MPDWFNRSVEDNIRVGRANATHEEVPRRRQGWRLRMIFILAKSEGYDIFCR